MVVSRGKVNDGPKISMRVERGHLVPVSAYDAELMNDWRDGAIVQIEPVRAMQRVMERRYFAMLNKLLKEADTPWTNTESAHEALKLAAGFTDPYKRKNGQWGIHPRSITSFTDRELDEYFEIFCGIIRERFGIDPETLGKEAADTGSSERAALVYSEASDDGPGADPIPASVGEPSSAVDPSPVDGPEAGGVDVFTLGDAPPADGLTLSPDDLDWLKTAARMLVAATEPGGGLEEVTTIDRQKDAIKQFLTPEAVSQRAIVIAGKIYNHCRKACLDNDPLDKEWVATLAGCRVSDLRPEAR